MDSSDPEIEFDSDGQCNHCRRYFSEGIKYITHDKKDTMISTLIKTKNDTTYIQGVSGGVDSSYTVLTAHRLGLNVKLIHIDNEFDDPKADRNIERLVKYTSFNIEYPKINLGNYHALQLAYLHSGVVDIEVPTDNVIMAITYRKAVKLNASFLSGSNIVTEYIQPQSWSHRKNDLPNLKDINSRYGTKRLQGIPLIGLLGTLFYQKIKRVKQINLLNYIDYNRERAKQELKDTLGWEDYGLKHGENIYTRYYQFHILPQRWGIDKRRSHFSTLICSGQMKREDALKELEHSAYLNKNILESDEQKICEVLKISRQELHDFIYSTPKRKYTDFATDDLIYKSLKMIRNIYRRC